MPLFPPKFEAAQEAKKAILLVIRRDPRQFGYQRSRWQLSMIAESCPWLKVSTRAGMAQLLKRLGIGYKRARDYVHSPDPAYQQKLDLIERRRLRNEEAREAYPFLYLDELTYYRQPTLARAYESRGCQQPLARRSLRSETHFRVLGALDAATGRLHFLQRKTTSTASFVTFWYQLAQAYPQAETIDVVVDNWPVHFHPDVLAPLQPQAFPFPPKLPANWPTEPSARAKVDNLPIQLLCLPTYASWLNPIEKLWRWLKQDVLHLHRLSDDWLGLRQQVADFLSAFSDGSQELLRYVGLLPI